MLLNIMRWQPIKTSHLQLIVCLILLWNIFQADPIVSEDHGILLKEHGIVYRNTNQMFLSVFVKLAIPEVVYHDTQLVATCAPDVHNAYTLKNSFVDDAKKKLSKFKTLANIAENNPSGRNKRSIGAILGLGLGALGLIFNGIATIRLNHHINEIEHEFHNFVNDQVRFNRKIIEVQKSVLKIIDQDFHEIERSYNNLACDSRLMYNELGNTLALMKWRSKLDNYFHFIDRGTFGGRLTSLILDTEDLKKVISDHPSLNGTIYAKNPNYFYLASKIAMLSAEVYPVNKYVGPLNLVMHYIIQAPVLIQKNSRKLYSVNTVPLFKENNCMLVDLPKFVYADKTTADPRVVYLKDEACEINELVSVCYEATSEIEGLSNARCFNAFENCTFIGVPCRMHYVYDYSGVLLSGQPHSEALYLKRGVVPGEKRIFSLKLNRHGTKFISWKNALYIQYENFKIEAPDYVNTTVWTKINIDLRWDSILANASLSLKGMELAGLLENITFNGPDNCSNIGLLEVQNWMGIAAFAIWIGFFLVIIIVLCIRKFVDYCRNPWDKLIGVISHGDYDKEDVAQEEKVPMTTTIIS